MLETFDPFIQSASSRYGVPVAWIKAVIMKESSGNPKAFRNEPAIHDASYGLMQLLFATAVGLGYTGTVAGLYDPAVNINLGTQLLGELRAKYGDDFRAVYSAYNSGSGTAYLSNPQVATNVRNAVQFLEEFISREPFIASTGALSGLLVVLLVWYWSKRKGKVL